MFKFIRWGVFMYTLFRVSQTIIA